MKKLTLLVLTAFAITANAQVYLGGQLGFWATKTVTDKKFVFQYSVLPEVGYHINSKWAVGTTIGVSNGDETLTIHDEIEIFKIGAFAVNPYVRFTFVKWDLVSLFVEGGGSYRYIFNLPELGYGSWQDIGKHQFNVGISPGIALNLSKHFSLVANIGFLGWQHYGKDYSTFGLLFNSNTLTFGAYYNF